MLHSTSGIVFHSIKYSETSVIVKIYTELFGIQSYLIKGIHSTRSKTRPALFQPVTLLDLVVYHKEKQSLQSVKEVNLAYPFKSIPFDIRKSSVAIFINELVYKAIREEESNPDLFRFLWQTIMHLDETEESVASFHLRFGIQLMHHLGIFPQNNHTGQLNLFNMRDGFFQSTVPDHPDYLDPSTSLHFSRLLEANRLLDGKSSGEARRRNSEMELAMNAETRNQLIEILLRYYQLHLPGFRGMQSHHILHEVMA
jgi:DNA repair protein RecO (recombination protein O)